MRSSPTRYLRDFGQGGRGGGEWGGRKSPLFIFSFILFIHEKALPPSPPPLLWWWEPLLLPVHMATIHSFIHEKAFPHTPPPPSLPVLMEKDPCIIFSSSVVGTSPTSCSHTRWWEPILVPCHTLTPSIFHLMKKVLPLTPPFTSCSNYFLKSSGGNLFYFLFTHSMVGTENRAVLHHSFIHSFFHSYRKWGGSGGGGGGAMCTPTPFRNLYKQHGFPPTSHLLLGALHHHHLLLLLLFSGECFFNT